MGTATRTRSQTRKTRSICNPESAEQGASSPFTVLSGNNIDSLNKRHKRKPAGGRTLFDKENSAPPFRRSSNFVDLSNTCLSESSKKSSRKRKHEKQLAIGSNRSNNDTIIAADAIETPLSSQHELCRPRPDVDAAENPSEPLVSTHADISNDSRIPPAIEGTNGANENETDQNNRCSSHGNSSNGVPAILLEGQGNDISKTEMSKDKDGALVVSSSSALALLQKEYERLFAKYKKLKERRMAEVEALYDKQNSHISNFVQATEELTEYYKGEIVALKQQVEDGNNSDILDRCKSLERANLDCRSELLQEQAKGLELRQENKRLKSLLLQHIADKQKHSSVDHVPVPGTQSGCSTDPKQGFTSNESLKLAHMLLERVLGLQLSFPDESEGCVRFRHGPTGFSFDIKEANDADIGELIEGGELLYQNVSLGLCRKAVDWMKEDVIFGTNQSQLLLKRLVGFLNRGLTNG